MNLQGPLRQALGCVLVELPLRGESDDPNVGLENGLDEIISLVDALAADPVDGLHDQDGAGHNLPIFDGLQEDSQVADQGVVPTEGGHS